MDKSFTKTYFDFSQIDWEKMQSATLDTLYMTFFSMLFVIVFGLLLGLLLFETKNSKHVLSQLLHGIVAVLVNVFRSIPFIILIVLLLPFTKFLIGTFLGAKAALPALIISASPFYARMVEIGFREVDSGVIEAAESMGASKFQIIYKVLIPESLPALVSGITVTAISMVGYTAMAGAIAAGGLGALAYYDGFQGRKLTITLVATCIILLIVFIIQLIGDFIVKRIDKRSL